MGINNDCVYVKVNTEEQDYKKQSSSLKTMLQTHEQSRFTTVLTSEFKVVSLFEKIYDFAVSFFSGRLAEFSKKYSEEEITSGIVSLLKDCKKNDVDGDLLRLLKNLACRLELNDKSISGGLKDPLTNELFRLGTEESKKELSQRRFNALISMDFSKFAEDENGLDNLIVF